jgi:4-diphosphocytidyl-2-C-methyl-D-erythritol kinase
MRGVRLLAPGKINWTLEVLSRRQDGYHELHSVMQTISLCDSVILRESDRTRLELTGHVSALTNIPAAQNIVIHAYEAVCRALGREHPVEIVIEKRLPVAGGLGGGASDAAAVLRGLPLLWDEQIDGADLRRIATDLGSDVPFFLECGTVLSAGRGDELTILSEAPRTHLVVVLRESEARKTAEMYASLREEDFMDGAQSIALGVIFSHRMALGDAQMVNSFERAALTQFPGQAEAVAALERATGGQAHLAGAGPSLFALVDEEEAAQIAKDKLMEQGIRAVACRTLASVEARRYEQNELC